MCSNRHASPLSLEGQKERAVRLAALLKIIDLKELNEEESQSILSIFSHKIITLNKHPINQKQYRSPQILKEEIRTGARPS